MSTAIKKRFSFAASLREYVEKNCITNGSESTPAIKYVVSRVGIC